MVTSSTMFRTSREHVFARIERLHRRAARLVYGADGAAEADQADADDQLVTREAAALAERVELRLPQLVADFDLDPLAVDVLLCTLAAEYDPFSRVLMRTAQREPGRPWIEVGTIAELLELPRERVPDLGAALAPEAPLRRWALVEREDGEVEPPLVATRIKVAARVAQHLVGDDRMPPGMTLRAPQAPSEDAVAAPLASRLERAFLSGEPLVIEVVGRPHTGRHGLARAIADRFALPLFTLDLAAEAAPDPRRLGWRLAEARREAKLARALLCLRNWDALMPSAAPPPGEEGPPPSVTPRMPRELVQLLDEWKGVLVLTAEE